MHEIRNDQAGQMAAPCDKRASRQIWLVVQFLDSLQDPVSGLRTDVFMVPQHLGDSHYRHTKIAGYVLQSNRHVLIISYWSRNAMGNRECFVRINLLFSCIVNVDFKVEGR